MTPALSRGIRKGIRTVLQAVASGALTALVTALAGGLDPAVQGIVMGAWMAVVAFAQNWLESSGKIPVLLPSPAPPTNPPASEQPVVAETVDVAPPAAPSGDV